MLIFKHQKSLKTASKIANGIAATVALASVIDVISDIQHQVSWQHILIEITIFSFSFVALLLLSTLLERLNLFSINEIRLELTTAKTNENYWRIKNESLIKDLASKIKDQFIEWGLTQSESEIGFLLIKGFSLNEIAQLRGISERTVREQAIHLYRKSNLKGRVDLSAFFLEDLL